MVSNLNLETDLALATELLDLQRLLSRWKLSGAGFWINEKEREKMVGLAQEWCDRIQSQYKCLAS